MNRQQMLDQLADLIIHVQRPHPVRIAIDGVDAAGKTTLANELSPLVEERGRTVIRASIDGFHSSRAERYERGVDSAEGYYYDSFNNEAIRTRLLLPLGPGGDRQIYRAVFDFRSDSTVEEGPYNVFDEAVLLFDGVFLLRPELNDCWDFRIFVQASFDETLDRACQRDQVLFGSADATRERYLKRYIPGQLIYLQTVKPHELADAVLENSDPANPRLSIGNQIE